jgi:hypothetical protein
MTPSNFSQLLLTFHSLSNVAKHLRGWRENPKSQGICIRFESILSFGCVMLIGIYGCENAMPSFTQVYSTLVRLIFLCLMLRFFTGSGYS